MKAEEYPFQHENRNCHINKDHFAASVDDYNCIHEEALYRPHLVKNGPIAGNYFLFYPGFAKSEILILLNIKTGIR